MKLDNLEINANESFNLEHNKTQIEKQAGPDGGKSGEFFFFTHDCKWILKTVTPEELMVFRKMFPSYMQHMHLNENSLINKIYGVFSVDLHAMETKLNSQ
jgi:hypothetical protein